MAHVITQNCCKDASCVPVCPVDCIRPAGGPGEFTGTEMLYIDPEACIDCGACMDECPVDGIHYEEDLPAHLRAVPGAQCRILRTAPAATGGDAAGQAARTGRERITAGRRGRGGPGGVLRRR